MHRDELFGTSSDGNKVASSKPTKKKATTVPKKSSAPPPASRAAAIPPVKPAVRPPTDYELKQKLDVFHLFLCFLLLIMFTYTSMYSIDNSVLFLFYISDYI